MSENKIATIIVNSSLKIHRSLGPGLLESVYEEILSYELNKAGLFISRQQPVGLTYEDVKLELGFRADLIVENKLIIEIKSIDAIAPVHQKQPLTYLRITNLKLGLLINFNVALIKDGIQRIANKL